MADNNVHRIFVVDTAGRPIDVVTQTDVFRYLYNRINGTVGW